MYEYIKHRLILCGLFLGCIMFMFFFFVGIYDAFYNVPAKNTKIAELTDQCDTWQARAMELDRYIAKQEKKYKLATRWSNFFSMMCDTDQKVRMDVVEDYVVQKNGLYATIPKNRK